MKYLELSMNNLDQIYDTSDYNYWNEKKVKKKRIRKRKGGLDQEK